MARPNPHDPIGNRDLLSGAFDGVQMIAMNASRTFSRMSLAFKAQKSKSPV